MSIGKIAMLMTGWLINEEACKLRGPKKALIEVTFFKALIEEHFYSIDDPLERWVNLQTSGRRQQL